MGWTLRLRWVWVPPALGLTACSGGGYDAGGTKEGVGTNRRCPYDSVSVRFVLRDQDGTLSGSYETFLDAGWTYIGEDRSSRSGQETNWRVDAPQGDVFSEADMIASSSGTVSATLFLSQTHTWKLALFPDEGTLGALTQRLKALGREPHQALLSQRGVWG